MSESRNVDKISLVAIAGVGLVLAAGFLYTHNRISELEMRTGAAERFLEELFGKGGEIKYWTKEQTGRQVVEIPYPDWHHSSYLSVVQVPDMSLTVHLTNKSTVYISYTVSHSRGQEPIWMHFGIFIDPKFDHYLNRWSDPSSEYEYDAPRSDIFSFHTIEELSQGNHNISLFWSQEDYDGLSITLKDRRVTVIAFPSD